MTCLAERLGKYREREIEGSKFIIWLERVKVKRNGMKFENTLFGQLIYTSTLKFRKHKDIYREKYQALHSFPRVEGTLFHTDDVARLPLTF